MTRLIALGAVVVAVCVTLPHIARATPAPATHPVLIIGRPVAVTIVFYLPPANTIASNTVPTGRVTVTDKPAVSSLARLANQLNPVLPGATGCPLDRNAHARLIFSYANGDRWTIVAHLDGCERASAHGVLGWILGPQTDRPERFFAAVDRLVGFKWG